MAKKGGRVTVERVESVPSDARVRDYDELGECAQTALWRLVAGDRPREVEDVSELEDGLVRFTDYYRVEYVESCAAD